MCGLFLAAGLYSNIVAQHPLIDGLSDVDSLHVYFCLPIYYAESSQNFTLTISKLEFDNGSSDPNVHVVTVVPTRDG